MDTVDLVDERLLAFAQTADVHAVYVVQDVHCSWGARPFKHYPHPTGRNRCPGGIIMVSSATMRCPSGMAVWDGQLRLRAKIQKA